MTQRLFEPESKEEAPQELMVRSQPAEGLAADSGQPAVGMARPVGGAAAQTPTMRQESDSAKPVRRQRGMSEAQVAGSTVVLTEQQLNSKKQNARRAKEKAEVRALAAKTPGTASTKSAPPPAQEGRILEAVADFWARKKARAAAKGEG